MIPDANLEVQSKLMKDFENLEQSFEEQKWKKEILEKQVEEMKEKIEMYEELEGDVLNWLKQEGMMPTATMMEHFE